MRKPKRSALAQSVLIALSSPLMFALPAMAQDAAIPAPSASAPEQSAAAPATQAPAQATPPTQEGLQQVTVTARRTKERLIDVPTSVTAITSKDLEDLKISSFQDVGQTVPNVYISKQAGAPSAPQMQIRGVANGSLNMQVDSGIGLYVDGVYIGRPGASAFELADLEQVEVLRGPQGTLFGRNATGGAINMITASPSGFFGGDIEAGVGNFGQRRAKLRLDTSEWNGLSARLTVGYTKIDGDIANTAPRQSFAFTGSLGPYPSFTTNERSGDSDTKAAMLAVHYKGIPDLKIDYKADLSDWKGTLDYRESGNLDANNQPVGFTYPSGGLYVPLEGTASDKVHGQSLVAEYALSKAWTLKYIFGLRGYKEDTPGNQVVGDAGTTDLGGGSFGTALFAMREESQHQHSHELQLIRSQGSVDVIAGLFAFEEKGWVNDPILFGTLYGGVPIGPTNDIEPANFNYFLGQDSAVDNKSMAAYLHSTWHVSDFDLSGGLRRTHDNRSELIVAGGAIGSGAAGAPAANQAFGYHGDHTDYDVSATYKLGKDANVYAKYATGYVSGGTLLGTRFGPEGMKAVELGYKTQAWDQRLRLGVSVFDQHRTNAQIEYFDSTNGGYLMGQGSEVSKGVEIESSLAATKSLSLNLAYGYVDAKSSGNLNVTQPKDTLYLGAAYTFPNIGEVVPSFRIDASYHTKYTTLKCNAGYAEDPGKDTCHLDPTLTAGQVAALPQLQEALLIPAGTQLSANLTFANIMLGQYQGKVSLWGRNLLNERHIAYNFSLGGTAIASTFDRPRTIGADFSLDF